MIYEAKNYGTAKNQCESDGALLAIPRSEVENDFIAGLIRDESSLRTIFGLALMILLKRAHLLQLMMDVKYHGQNGIPGNQMMHMVKMRSKSCLGITQSYGMTFLVLNQENLFVY